MFFFFFGASPDHGPKMCVEKKKVFERLSCMDGCCRLPHRTERKKNLTSIIISTHFVIYPEEAFFQ